MIEWLKNATEVARLRVRKAQNASADQEMRKKMIKGWIQKMVSLEDLSQQGLTDVRVLISLRQSTADPKELLEE